jgi:hypothetical protein
MRIFVGGLSHEASVFSPVSTPRASFVGWGDGERPPVAALEADRIIYGYLQPKDSRKERASRDGLVKLHAHDLSRISRLVRSHA